MKTYALIDFLLLPYVQLLVLMAFVILIATNAKRFNRFNPVSEDGMQNKKLKLFLLIIGLLATVIAAVGKLFLKFNGSIN